MIVPTPMLSGCLSTPGAKDQDNYTYIYNIPGRLLFPKGRKSTFRLAIQGITKHYEERMRETN